MPSIGPGAAAPGARPRTSVAEMRATFLRAGDVAAAATPVRAQPTGASMCAQAESMAAYMRVSVSSPRGVLSPPSPVPVNISTAEFATPLPVAAATPAVPTAHLPPATGLPPAYLNPMSPPSVVAPPFSDTAAAAPTLDPLPAAAVADVVADPDVRAFTEAYLTHLASGGAAATPRGASAAGLPIDGHGAAAGALASPYLSSAPVAAATPTPPAPYAVRGGADAAAVPPAPVRVVPETVPPAGNAFGVDDVVSATLAAGELRSRLRETDDLAARLQRERDAAHAEVDAAAQAVADALARQERACRDLEHIECEYDAVVAAAARLRDSSAAAHTAVRARTATIAAATFAAADAAAPPPLDLGPVAAAAAAAVPPPQAGLAPVMVSPPSYPAGGPVGAGALRLLSPL